MHSIARQKGSTRRFVLLKLTTDRHEASRGLFATAAATYSVRLRCKRVNPLDSKDNYSATSNNTKLVHWPLMGGLLQLIQRGGAWAGCGPAQSPPRCINCHSPPINGQSTGHYCYDGPLLCGFNVAIKAL